MLKAEPSRRELPLNLYRDLADLPADLRGGAVSIGNFDGVHRGHARIVEQLRAEAARVGGPALVFTFDPHPVQILRPEFAPPLLCGIERKAELLSRLGVDGVLAYPTNPQLLELTAEQFFQQILVDAFDAKAVVEGPNFFFGKDREGTVDVLSRLCDRHGLGLRIVEPVPLDDGRFVSSSRLREWISAGRIEDVNPMLTQPYQILGTVVHGDARGATIGFPTANLADIDTLLPAAGVYAGAAIVNGQRHLAAINIGPKPTFADQREAVEAHLLDFSGDLYHQPLQLEFTRRLRDVVAFDNVDKLRAQLQSDIAAVRKLH